MSNLIFQQQGSSPSDAGSGYSQIYAKSDGKVYRQAGTDSEVEISGLEATAPGLSANKASVKVWLNYDHVNDSVKSSFNVSSVDDNAAGNFTINFATSLSDTEYAVSGMTNGTSSDGNNTYGMYLNNHSLMTTSSVKLITQAAGGTDGDNLVNCITIHGN